MVTRRDGMLTKYPRRKTCREGKLDFRRVCCRSCRGDLSLIPPPGDIRQAAAHIKKLGWVYNKRTPAGWHCPACAKGLGS